jgi:hypothetical protein
METPIPPFDEESIPVLTDVLVPGAPAAAMPDAESIAARLRESVASYLTRDLRKTIEAHCREALADHATWLVNQVTKEVALSLESRMLDWVREAVDDEMKRRPTDVDAPQPGRLDA